MKNNILFENERQSRDALGELNDKNVCQITAMVGLFNASSYLENIKSELIRQTYQNFFIILVDNDSTDGTWNQISSWPDLFPGRLIAVKNSFNLGGFGSLLLNLDLVKTGWFTWINQDDLYKEIHIETLERAINACEENVVTLSTSMGSVDASGRKIGRNPRAQWLVSKHEQPDLFLANLHTQTVPWPSTAFRTDAFNRIEGNWTSSAFSDTEFTLYLSAYGKFKFIDKETMYYRENPISESHLVTESDRDLTTTICLTRVFNSKEFLDILKLVKKEDRSKFLEDLDNGIKNRVVNKSNLQLLLVMTHEIIAKEWGYIEPNVLKLLYSDYSDFASIQSTDLVERLLNNSLRDLPNFIIQKRVDQTHDALRNLTLGRKKRSIGYLLRKLYSVIGIYIPYRAGKIILKNFLQTKLRLSKNHRWKYFE